MTSNQDINKINSLFSQLQSMISCDGPCLQKREAENLKQNMINAETNIMTAPNKFKTAQKKYVTFVAGEETYDELRDQQLKNKADDIIKEYNIKYNEIGEKIKTQIETYEGIFINFNNVKELYFKYKKENTELEKNMKNTVNDVLTNERKTFYQDQQVDVLKFYYYYILFFIYYICIFCFVIFSLIYPSKTDWKIRLVIFIGLILLPFVSTWLLGLFIYIIYECYNLLPKNVYKEEIDAQINYK
jgi:hypothetical protein